MNKDKQKRSITRAIKYAEHYHSGQLDDDGEDYFQAHIAKVAGTIAKFTDDRDVIMAAYLHDVIEDTTVTEEGLRAEFGDRITDLVMEVTHEGQKDEYGYYFPRLKSKEGIMIKLADRLSNISRMDSWDEKRQAQYLKKTKFWKDGTNKR